MSLFLIIGGKGVGREQFHLTPCPQTTQKSPHQAGFFVRMVSRLSGFFHCRGLERRSKSLGEFLNCRGGCVLRSPRPVHGCLASNVTCCSGNGVHNVPPFRSEEPDSCVVAGAAHRAAVPGFYNLIIPPIRKRGDTVFS